MAINFPGSLDNFTNPTSSSPINSPSHADQHANANDAIEALEAKVGVDGSSVVTSHDYKISQLQSLVTSAVAGAKSIYQDVRNQSGSAFTKATPVYVSGSTGASGQLLVSAASNATEATSSKTMGITTSAISNNSNGQVISEGILEGIDTTGAADGDPVWLGVNGAKIYGLANKPSAPAHLVFLGIVIRGGQANTGSMYVKIQNGFELHELHNVEVSSLVNGNILAYDSTTQTWKNTNTLQSTSSAVPFVIKGATSQTANLQQWQTSNGYPITYVDKDGNIATGGNILSNYLSVNYFANIGGSYNSVALTVRGVSGQTANLQEWKNSAETVLSSITASGDLNFGTNLWNIKTSGANVIQWQPSTGSTFLSYGSSNIPITVQGSSGQTGDLQQWRNSTGTVLSNINSSGLNEWRDSSGNYRFGLKYSADKNIIDVNSSISGLVFGWSPYYVGGYGTDFGAGNTWWFSPWTFDRVGVIIVGKNSQTADLQQWKNYSGTLMAAVKADGSFRVGGANGATKFLVDQYGTLSLGTDRNNTGTPTYLFVQSQLATDIGAVIKAAASQTADIQQWQNSAGTVLAKVDANGAFYAGGISAYTNGNVSIGNTLSASYMQTVYTMNIATYASGPVSQVPLTINGVSGQTGNLTEWKNNSGTVLARIQSDGALVSDYITSGIYLTSLGKLRAGSASNYGGQLEVTTTAAGNIGAIIRGSASQTADLQQWQNSAGTVLSSIKYDGSIKPPAIYTDQLYTAVDYGPYMLSQSDGWKLINRTSVSNINLIVKGMSGQTGDLQQWQNSAGTVLAKVDANGSITTNGSLSVNTAGTGNLYLGDGTISKTSGSSFNFNSGIISNNINIVSGYYGSVGLIVKAAASQTANLQEWQNSAGTVLSRIASNGRMVISSDTEASSGMLTISQAAASAIVLSTTSTANDYGLALNATGSGNGTSVGISFSAFATNGYNGVATPGGAIWFTRSGSYSLGYLSFLTRSGTAANDPLTERMRIGDTGTVSISGFTASSQGLIVKGASSQTASLQEWQNSSGVMVAKIDASGNGTFGQASFAGGAATIDGGGGAALGAIYTGSLRNAGTSYNFFSNVTGSPYATVVVKQLSGQTTNLQEWQDNSGTTQAYVSPTGKIWIKNDSSFNPKLEIGSFFVDGFGGIYSNETVMFGSLYYGDRFASGAVTIINRELPSSIVLGIKGKPSQTGDLTQWRDSAGTVKASIAANGDFTNNAIFTAYGRFGGAAFTDAAALRVNGYNPSVPTAVIKAIASQTANLQEWQNSNGTVLNAINTSGNFIGGQFDVNGNLTNVLYVGAIRTLFAGNPWAESQSDEVKLSLYGKTAQTSNFVEIKSTGAVSGKLLLAITPDGSIKGGNSNTISVNTASTVDTVALSSFTSMEYTLSIKQGSKIRSSKVLVHTDGTSVDSTEYGIMEMGGGITGILVTASVSSTNAILQVTITDAATTNATVKLIKTML